MSRERLLFDTGTVAGATALARRSDPETSKESGRKTEKELGDKHAAVLRIMAIADRPLLANEISRDAHKRMKELVERGLVETCGEKFDTTTRRKATLYRRVK